MTIPDLLPVCTSISFPPTPYGRKGFSDLADVVLLVFFDSSLLQQKIVQHLRGVWRERMRELTADLAQSETSSKSTTNAWQNQSSRPGNIRNPTLV